VQLRVTNVPQESHALVVGSAAERWSTQWRVTPRVVTIAQADGYLQEWRQRTNPETLLVVIPMNKRKLYWNVLRDVVVTLLWVINGAQVKPNIGTCVLTWIGSERQAKLRWLRKTERLRA